MAGGKPRTGLGRLFCLGTALAVVAGVSATASPAWAADATRSQWYLQQLNIPAAWQIANGAGVTVADLASGVDSTQTDLTGTLLPELDFSTGQPVVSTQGDDSTDYVSTNAAVLITGSGHGSAGVEGIAPGAKILPIRDAEGTTLPNPANVAGAIEYAVTHGAKIVLMPGSLSSDSTVVAAAVRFAVTHNAIVVTATGNNGKTGNPINTPCDSPGALCVSGTDQNGVIWPYASTGAAVNLAAPAVNLPIAVRGGGGLGSSTHFAAALAAGAAALVWSAHPKWSAGQVIRALIDTATGGNAAHTRANDQIGYGIIAPLAAMHAAEPAAVTNPFLPLALATTPPPSSAATVPAGHKQATSAGSGSGIWLAAGGAVLATVLGVGIIWWILRRRTRRGDYMADPGYGAGTYGQSPYYQPVAPQAAGPYPAPAPIDPDEVTLPPQQYSQPAPAPYQPPQPVQQQPQQPAGPAPYQPPQFRPRRYEPNPQPYNPNYEGGGGAESPGPIWGVPPTEPPEQ